eukprot:8266343-Lingulodinium_polyedra.AAC.1
MVLVATALPELSQDEVLAIACRRLGHLMTSTEWSEELMQVDEAADLLDRGDMQQMQQQQKSSKDKMEEASNFRDSLKEMAQQIAADNKAGTGAEHTNKKTDKKSRAPAKHKQMPTWPQQNIDVHDARACVPGGGFIWRDAKFGSWQGHYPPYPRVGRSWNKYGEAEALVL